jgi:magnesium-transporting ATPase (P-type)
VACVTGRSVRHDGAWVAQGDPMEAALHCLARRAGLADEEPTVRRPYTADRMLSSALVDGRMAVLGAPEAVLARCVERSDADDRDLRELTDAGLRVLAVAERAGAHDLEREEGLRLVGLLALQDPPREDVADALRRCRTAGVRVAMITGDHPRTAAAIGRQVGLLGDQGVVLDGPDLPADDVALAAAVDRPGGVVIARATPADKLRIARALRTGGHVVAMTGDGVNDAPALREADVGVAMGASGSDVAREAADLVLLDDHFATIVTAVELGRATFQNVRRFLTYHLTDNVAELAPFALWALTGSNIPLAIGVLQVLALDIGTDMLPALALGAEPPRPDVMSGRHRRRLVDRALLLRSFLVLGVTEAVVALTGFLAVLLLAGWRWGDEPDSQLLAVASGTAFAAIAIGQMANAVACRSTTRPVWRLRPLDNPLVLSAIGAELVLLVAFLGFPPLADLLGGAWPTWTGWGLALLAAPAVVLADSAAKLTPKSSTAR